MRVFLALPLSDSLRDAARVAQRDVRDVCGGWDVRWTPPEGLHLTLRFIGEVDDSRAAAIADGLRDLDQVPAFSFSLEGVGSFPERGAPRIIWIGVRKGEGDLRGLAKAVDPLLEKLGLSPEPREFRAHLTIGRVKSPRGCHSRVLDPFRSMQVGLGQADHVTLYRSELRPTGSQYHPLMRYELAKKIQTS